MVDDGSEIRLNENQRRHFEVLLSRLEESVSKIQASLDGQNQPDVVLRVIEDDVPAAYRATARPLLEQLRRDIARLSRDLGLRPRRTSQRRVIAATLTAEAVRLEDSLASQMRGYGQVDPSLELYLDPRLEALARSLNELASLLDRHPHTRSTG